MNTFLFTQITNTVLGLLIIGGLVFLINKKYKEFGIISIVLAIIILLIGIITPISIVLCFIVAIILGGLGVYSINKDKKNGIRIG
jgi:chromate transport protein ChrA